MGSFLVEGQNLACEDSECSFSACSHYIPAFTEKIVEEFCEGKHEEMAASAQGADAS